MALEDHKPFQPSDSTNASIVEVAAGLIFRDGLLLIARRHPDSHLGGLWEFPGGKREAGETFEQALVRELNEELGARVEVGELVEAVTHRYPAKTVRIQFHLCSLVQGEPRAVECSELAWIKRTQLHAFPFPDADARLIERLAAEDRFWGQDGFSESL